MGTIFSSTDIRGRTGESETTEYMWNAGKAFAEWLPEQGDVVVVKAATADPGVAHAFIEGLLLQGRTVVDAGTGGQNELVEAIGSAKAAGGALIDSDTTQNMATIMLFDADTTQVTDETGLNTINELIESGNFLPASEKGKLTAQ